MSGGSYNYLCYVSDLEDLLGKMCSLQEMADRLAELGYAKDAAAETLELLLLMRQFDINMRVRVKRLADVWHAVEWWESCDSSEQQVHEALTAYRKVAAPPQSD